MDLDAIIRRLLWAIIILCILGIIAIDATCPLGFLNYYLVR